jgi:hypothetical protein
MKVALARRRQAVKKRMEENDGSADGISENFAGDA